VTGHARGGIGQMSGTKKEEKQLKVLVSACLLGEKVRYNGSSLELDQRLLAELGRLCTIIPCCPELAGGLTVPRAPVEIVARGKSIGGESVLSGQAEVNTAAGDDLTEQFIQGAEKALQKCREQNVRMAILTERSPSCGVTMIYDGTFSGNKIAGRGVTTALLRQNGVQVFSQDQLDLALLALAKL